MKIDLIHNTVQSNDASENRDICNAVHRIYFPDTTITECLVITENQGKDEYHSI